MWFWHWLVAVTGSDAGLSPGRWSFYGFWSGFGSDLGEVTLLAFVLAAVRRHVCHARGCWRAGRHRWEDPSTGVSWVLCSRHHPDADPAGPSLPRPG